MFGAEVRQALEERRAVLHELGVAPGDPDRVAQLRELQRRAVGEEVAARSRQKFLAQAPSTFRGRLRPLQEHDAYAVVSDGARFVLVPASPELRVPSEFRHGPLQNPARPGQHATERCAS